MTQPAIDWEKTEGLVPAVVQDADTGRVLMLGYMNLEALEKTRESGRVTFYSRSKQRLWTKGETSGNHLELVSLAKDCDADALLVQARPAGPTCHLGRTSCFEGLGKCFGDPGRVEVDGRSDVGDDGKCFGDPGRVEVDGQSDVGDDGRWSGAGAGAGAAGSSGNTFRVLAELDDTIARRLGADPERSYTARLLRDGPTRIARKLGEEALETVLAATGESDQRLAEESADLLYHLLVLLHSRGMTLADVANVLRERRGG